MGKAKIFGKPVMEYQKKIFPKKYKLITFITLLFLIISYLALIINSAIYIINHTNKFNVFFFVIITIFFNISYLILNSKKIVISGNHLFLPALRGIQNKKALIIGQIFSCQIVEDSQKRNQYLVFSDFEKALGYIYFKNFSKAQIIWLLNDIKLLGGLKNLVVEAFMDKLQK